MNDCLGKNFQFLFFRTCCCVPCCLRRTAPSNSQIVALTYFDNLKDAFCYGYQKAIHFVIFHINDNLVKNVGNNLRYRPITVSLTEPF